MAHPDHVETVDIVGGKLRAERERDASPPATSKLDHDAVFERPGAKIGRYHLLELVGTGGMGLVWGAWDPELERRVALKLVRTRSRASRDQMLREGQVLARFSHPNVVQIFDVGEIGDQVFLVMEWVRGTTLRAYAELIPGLRALLDAYRQAGHGLDAAHRAGVIHRDFKPDNAIRGDDGRVRVLDFGLAHASDPEPSPTNRQAGTPRYMAPEQLRGDTVTAAADQFAYCIALHEALELNGTVPRWIAAVVQRGTRAEIAERFGSMTDLLIALDRDPHRARRRLALGVAAVATAIAAFTVGRSRAAVELPAREPCSGGITELSTAWSAPVRAQILQHLRSLGSITSDEADGTERKLDGYAKTWVSEHRTTCEANERKALTSQLYEARVSCLRRARSQLAGVVDLLGHAHSADDFVTAQRSLAALPDVHNCQLVGPVAPPPAAVAAQVKAISERVEQAWVRATARQSDALGVAGIAASDAYRTGYQPLIARALLVKGWAATIADQPVALEALDKAWRVALTSFDESLAVESYARWIYAGVRLATPSSTTTAPSRPLTLPPQASVITRALDEDAPTTTLEMWPMMRVIAERLGDEGRLARALLYNNLALPLIVAGDKRGARELLQLAQRSAGDAPPIELTAILENLARLEPNSIECERQLRNVLAQKQAVLGSTHPDTLGALRNLAIVTRDRNSARAAFQAACRGLLEREQVSAFRLCAYEAGWFADEGGDHENARAWMKDAVELPDIKGRIASAYLAVQDSVDPGNLLVELEHFASQSLPDWLDRVDAADALVVLAQASERNTRVQTNRVSVDQAWQRALRMLETIDYVHFDRRKARVRAFMAEHLAKSRAAEARSLATKALTWYRGIPGEEELVKRLEQVAAQPSR